MNTKLLTGWINEPELLGKDASAQLDALTQTFPYFQTAQLLYIKSLHNETSFLYNNQLKIAAAYVPNRRVLYELITRKKGAGAAAVAVEEKTEAKKEVSLPEKTIHPEFPQKRFVKNPDEWESAMLRQLQLLQHWKTTPAEIIQQKIENEKKAVEQEKPKTETDKPTAADEINTLIYVLAEPGESEDISVTDDNISEEPGWEVQEITEEKAVPEDPVQQEIIREAISSSIELEVDDTLPTPEELMGGITSSQKKTEEENIVKREAEKSEPEVSANEQNIPADISFSGWLKLVSSGTGFAAKEADIAKEKTVSDELIDKFIEEQPRITPKKTAFYNPVDMAKKSVQEHDEFITETLARIYVKQGNIPRAIRAYNKLSLKFPEKSAYFAALIEELKRTPH